MIIGTRYVLLGPKIFLIGRAPQPKYRWDAIMYESVSQFYSSYIYLLLVLGFGVVHRPAPFSSSKNKQFFRGVYVRRASEVGGLMKSQVPPIQYRQTRLLGFGLDQSGTNNH